MKFLQVIFDNYLVKWEMTNDEYDNLLDEIYGPIDVCGIESSASIVLKLVDEVRYDIGKSEEEDNQRQEKMEKLGEELQELKDELELVEENKE